MKRVILNLFIVVFFHTLFTITHFSHVAVSPIIDEVPVVLADFRARSRTPPYHASGGR